MSEHTADPARSGENRFGTAFAEADRRLAGMHGYEPAPPKLDQQGRAYIVPDQIEPIWQAVLRVEAKLDRLEKALKAGAIGQWGNQRDAQQVADALARGEVPQTDGR